MPLHRGYNDPYFRSLPFDQQLARISLQSINPGPDGVESMSKCQCRAEIYGIQGHERFYDDYLLVGEKPAKDGEVKKGTWSPLLTLPKKVRNKIYAYLVTYPEPIPIRLHSTTTSPIGVDADSRDTVIARHSWFFSPPFLRKCPEIEQEATPLFFATNEFKAELTDGDTAVLVAWLRNTDSAYLKLVPKLIMSLEPRSYFDLDKLRRADGSADMNYDHQMLSKLLIGGGISADKIVMVNLTPISHLAQDAYLLRRGTRDTEKLVRAWFESLQRWLDFEEYNFGALGEEEYGEGEEGAGEKFGVNDDVGLVTGKMKQLMRSR